MSIKYMHSKDIPTDVLCKRLTELSNAITKGKRAIEREFTMSIPTELDRDADFVLDISACRLINLDKVLVAAIKTLNDNRHLCDGDVCTLKELRDAVAETYPNWDRPRSENMEFEC